MAVEDVPVLRTRVDPSSKRFAENAEQMRGFVEELRSRRDAVQLGGGEAQMERHRSRGKLPARERVDALIDELLGRGFHRQQVVKMANLEDVFLDLTGRQLREG